MRPAKVLFFLAVFLLNSCSVPQNLVGVENPDIPTDSVKGNTVHRIFIATTRQRSDETDVFFSGDRSASLSFAAIDVSVPPSHVTGQVERPEMLPPDPNTEFVLANPQVFADGHAFKRSVDKDLANRPYADRDALVFVHGYNTNFSAAVLRIAQFVHDSGFQGVPVLFTWASEGSALDYVYDMNSAIIARDALGEMAKYMDAPHLNGVDIVAHSMGNLVTMEAIRLSAHEGTFNKNGRLRNIVLASPDIDVELFRTQISAIPRKQRHFIVLVSDDDGALRMSQRLAGGSPRVGQADPDTLTEMGVSVIDLSQIEDDSSIHHSKFADAPQVVHLIGQRVLAGDTFSPDRRIPLGQSILLTVDGITNTSQ